MFSTAKSISPPAAPAAKGKAKPELHVKGVEQLAMIRALEKALETVSGTFDQDVKSQVFEHYAKLAAETGQRPENIKAIDGDATASVTLSKKSSSTALTEQQIALLREHGLEPHRDVVTVKLFAVNPAYAGDDALLAKVTKALSGIVPEDFIVLQDERVKYTVTDEVLAQVFSNRAPREVLEICTSMSCSPKLAVTNINRILDFARELLSPPLAVAGSVAAPATVADTAPVAKPAKVKKLKAAA